MASDDNSVTLDHFNEDLLDDKEFSGRDEDDSASSGALAVDRPSPSPSTSDASGHDRPSSPHAALEFQVVESRCGIRPGLKTTVPYDYLNTSSGSGWDQLLRNANEELRKQMSTSEAGA